MIYTTVAYPGGGVRPTPPQRHPGWSTAGFFGASESPKFGLIADKILKGRAERGLSKKGHFFERGARADLK